MLLTEIDIRYVATVAHEGKVVVVGTASDGSMHYSVKRGGFEDSALEKGANPFGFEPWKPLRLGESAFDPSVAADEPTTMSTTAGALLLRSVYGSGDEVMRTVDAPVQLFSALGHLYVFRQNVTGKILVSRFVLDGMNNELVPRLEVRFRRARQRLSADGATRKDGGKLQSTDSLDYRDMDGKPFYAPAMELGFVDPVANGWFCAVMTSTAESDKQRWHVFAVDATTRKLLLHSVRVSEDGLFDPHDYVFASQDPNNPKLTMYRTVPGLIRRTIDLSGQTIASRPSATVYDLQREIVTDAGPQLTRGDTRVLLAVPVTTAGVTSARVAALSFGVCIDGTLSQVDPSADAAEVLRSSAHDLILPLALMDSIREVAALVPPPSGTIAAMDRGEDDLLRIRSTQSLPRGMNPQANVALRGTQSYDGHYRVASVSGSTFTVATTFVNNEPGFWEVIPEAQAGLVFDGMIVGYEKTTDGKLMIHCAGHSLVPGDEVQISGTRGCDGTYQVVDAAATANSFTLNVPFSTGEALNLKTIKRRGLRMNGNDSVTTPELPLSSAGYSRSMGRTVSAWVRVSSTGSVEQKLVEDAGELIRLSIGTSGRAMLAVRLGNGTTQTLTDAGPLAVNTWTHFAGVIRYDAPAGSTMLSLCRNGVQVAAAEVARGTAPPHLGTAILTEDGNDYIDVASGAALFAGSFTVSCFVRCTGGQGTHRSPLTCRNAAPCQGVIFYAMDTNVWAAWIGEGSKWRIVNGPALVLNEWTHLALTWNGSTLTFYVNGTAVGEPVAAAYKPASGVPLRIGGGGTEGPLQFGFQGQVADVRVYGTVRSVAEINSDMIQRLTGNEAGLAAYWPLDDGTGMDRSAGKRACTVAGNPLWVSTLAIPTGKPASAPNAFTLGATLDGEIADVQIWNEARTATDIKNTMYLSLTGLEPNLAGYYRLGALIAAQGTSPAMTPDFSASGLDAVVNGDPFVGAQRLNRATGSGSRVVKYASEELIAVSRRGMYEESVEFKVTSPDPAFSVNNADGKGGKLFSFAYWGKYSRSSEEKIPFPSANVQQVDFQDLGGGWFRASCRVVIPEGVSLMRAFELGDVKGRWTVEATPPANEWIAVDIRKHRIRAVSDAVTRNSYTDAIALSTLSDPAESTQGSIAQVLAAESKVNRQIAEIRMLTMRRDVALDKSRFEKERTTLINLKPVVQAQITARMQERTAIAADPFNYYCRLKVSHNSCVIDISAEGRPIMWDEVKSSETQKWKIVRTASPWLRIQPKSNKALALEVQNAGGGGSRMALGTYTDQGHQQWQTIARGGSYFSIHAKHIQDTCLDSTPYGRGSDVLSWNYHGGSVHLWKVEPAEMHEDGEAVYKAKADEIARLDAEVLRIDRRIAELGGLLAGSDTVASLDAALTNARTALTTALNEYNTVNTACVNGMVKAPPMTMPSVAKDSHGLETTGALLAFAQPAGAVTLRESAMGTVQLAYVDKQGRLRNTEYDIVADSRNQAFEQWLPDASRSCASLQGTTPIGSIMLSKNIPIPATGWTLEGWAHVPGSFQASGAPTPKSYLLTSTNEAPIAIYYGNRLGTTAGDWFFDSGVRLDETVAPGWHHLAAVGEGGRTKLYVDGGYVGSVSGSASMAQFDGASSYLQVPAFASPTQAMTVTAWVKSATATWSSSGCIVSKRDAFIIHPNAGTKELTVYLYVAGQGAKSTSVTFNQIQDAWIHVALVFDGNSVMLYINGDLATQTAAPGTINPDSGVMWIGRDDLAEARYFNGQIAEVSLWDRALTVTDIRQFLHRPIPEKETGLVGYWPMRIVEKAGARQVLDASPAGRHASVVGPVMDKTVLAQCSEPMRMLGPGCGRMAEVRLWNVALSDDEILAHSTALMTGTEPGLVGYWPLNEGSGTTVNDRSSTGAHGTFNGAVAWSACTAAIGTPGRRALGFLDGFMGTASLPTPAITNTSFSVEFWARRSVPSTGQQSFLVGLGPAATNQALHIGFRATGAFTFAFYGNDLNTTATYSDALWHHWACTYDATTMTQTIYRDGVVVGQRKASAHFSGSGALILGAGGWSGSTDYFYGQLAELRFWSKERSAAEIQAGMNRTLTGKEANLLAYYPLDKLEGGKVREAKADALVGSSSNLQALWVSDLPIAAGDHLVTVEYSSMNVDASGAQQALLRRLSSFAQGGAVHLHADRRVEELTVQWIGNMQLQPTLLGYIEGAPPVPSENLTVEIDYDAATSVKLEQSTEVGYSWHRTSGSKRGMEAELFAGASWEMLLGGLGLSTKISEGKVGFQHSLRQEDSSARETEASARSAITMTDSLELVGMAENEPAMPHLGIRYLPKNVGYALVVSGMADVFATKLRRSGRMVSYDIRPVEGVPLDVNTITFMLNPAYVLNGSLDGLVGSMPADPKMYGHVPEMRAQYGALYPASYYRLNEAYDLKQRIDRMDKVRESFFYNFHAYSIDDIQGIAAASAQQIGVTPPSAGQDGSAPADLQGSSDELKSEAQKREAQIVEAHRAMNGQVRALAAFDDWQRRMETIELHAGKHNIVNTYVWDADGGLRAEEQSFASTIEHTISTEQSLEGGGGGKGEGMASNFAFDFTLVGSGGTFSSADKRLSTEKSLKLNVDLSGLEKHGVTDLHDQPMLPGEKVSRYRFMSFYLEGATDHFHDFFSTVVDPDWLMTNSEEARALRMTQAGKPNKCWRVLHRVTYVERPTLMGFDTASRVVQSKRSMASEGLYLLDLDKRTKEMEDKLAEILTLLKARSDI